MNYKPLNMFLTQSDKLRELILENPDLPIIVSVDSDVVADDCGYWYAPELRFRIGEILDCEQPVNEERVYTDRDAFYEDVQYMVECEPGSENLTDEEFVSRVKETMAAFDSYWKPVIIIEGSI